MGIEKFYKISLDNKVIGFFLLEKIDNYPYYLDYFAIYEEYQNKGYGTIALKELLVDVIKEDGLIGEIERIDDENSITKRRFEFYEKLGFRKIDSEYLLYDVLYNPIVYNSSNSKEILDEMFFKYYEANAGLSSVKKNCKIIK